MLHDYSHRNLGKSWSYKISFATLTIVFLFHSATPFFNGFYGVIHSLLMPSFAQKYLNSLSIYSPPLSKKSNLIFSPVTF